MTMTFRGYAGPFSELLFYWKLVCRTDMEFSIRYQSAQIISLMSIGLRDSPCWIALLTIRLQHFFVGFRCLKCLVLYPCCANGYIHAEDLQSMPLSG